MTGRRKGKLLLLAVSALAAAAAASPATAATTGAAAAPKSFKIYVNGRQLSAKALALTGDTYIPVKAGKLTIGVSWVNALQGSGYKVIITSPSGSDRRLCSRGTSCLLAARKALKNGDETSWSVQIYKGPKLVSEKALCLAGKS